MSFRFPSAFMSHGTPMHAFGEDPFQQHLHDFAASMPKPKAIVILSAHSVSAEDVFVLSNETNTIQYDFNGFPKELYAVKYSCPGDPALAEKIVGLLKQGQFQAKTDTQAPLDHGIWVPLLHLYPKGDVPVVRVSLPLNLIPAKILKLGHTLAPLRDEGILILGSGGAVHNLSQLDWTQKNEEGLLWAQDFENWIIEKLNKKDVDALVTADEHPLFHRAHPSIEHFLPILFAVGATRPGDEVNILHRKIEYGTLSMLCFSLNHVQKQPALH